MLRCKKKCCSITTILLRVCNKAIITYKSQDITVSEKEIWEKIMLVNGAKKELVAKPGIEQVLFSRAKELIDMVVDGAEEHPFTTEGISRIGESAGYDKRQLLLQGVCELHDRTVPVMMRMIAEHDERIFNGGYDALVKWYCSAAGYRETADSGELLQEDEDD